MEFRTREANETGDDPSTLGIVVTEPGWMICYPRWPPAFSVSQNEVPTSMCTAEKPKPGLLSLCSAFGVCQHQRREPRPRLAHFRLPVERTTKGVDIMLQ